MRLVEDYKAFTSSGGGMKKFTTLLLNPCFHSVCLFRLSSFMAKIHLDVVGKIIWYINRLIFHVDIDYRADLAGGFVLVHGLGVVIGRGVRSNGKLTVYQGVTIGGSMGKKKINENGNEYSMPVFADNVVVYTDAKIFGPILIGEGTVIKAGMIVSHDFL